MSKKPKKIGYGFNLDWRLSYFGFSGYWMCFNFYRNYKFCSRNICAITEGIKKYKSIIRNKEKHDKIVFFAKSKLNCIEVLIFFKVSIDSYISHDEFVSVNNQ